MISFSKSIFLQLVKIVSALDLQLSLKMKKLVVSSLVLLSFLALRVHSQYEGLYTEEIVNYYNKIDATDGSKEKMVRILHEKLRKSVNCEATCMRKKFLIKGFFSDSYDENARQNCLNSCKGLLNRLKHNTAS